MRYGRLVDLAESQLFTRLGPGERLGAGDCSAIAVALNRDHPIAIDDSKTVNRALDEARATGAKSEIHRTLYIIVTLIRIGVINIADADQIKDDWAANHNRLTVQVILHRLLSAH
jgi:predicted nucleic acid-binding protein